MRRIDLERYYDGDLKAVASIQPSDVPTFTKGAIFPENGKSAAAVERIEAILQGSLHDAAKVGHNGVQHAMVGTFRWIRYDQIKRMFDG